MTMTQWTSHGSTVAKSSFNMIKGKVDNAKS